MRLLDRYLLRELVIPLGYCLGGFFLFWVSFDLLSELKEFQSRGLWVSDVVTYYLILMPQLLFTVTPVALLLALLYALTNHARYQELTAMRAAGISLGRITAPYIVIGFLLSLGMFALNELWIPQANDAANRVLARREPRSPDSLGPEWQRNLTFRNEAAHRIWNIGAFNRRTGEMLAPSLQWPLPDGAVRRLVARRAEYDDGHWVFFNARQLTYPKDPDALPVPFQTNRLVVKTLTETPEQIRSEIKFSELSDVKASKRPVLSLREIRDYQRLHPHLGPRQRAKLETQFYGRLAEPWRCLVVVLIAIPFGAASGRRNVFVGVASGIFLVFAYFIIATLGGALGTGGYAPPWLSAWLPNLVFAGGGLLLMRRVQ